MQSPENNIALESNAGTYHAGVESAVLRSNVAVSTLSDQRSDDVAAGPMDAAVGIKNGLLLAAAFWVSAYAVFALISYLV